MKNKIERVAVFGAGGHAKVIISALQARGIATENVAVFDDDVSKRGMRVLGCEVLGAAREYFDAKNFDVAVLAIGSNRTRKKVAESFSKNFDDAEILRWLTVIHPAAIVHPSAQIGAGTVVMAGAIIQPDAQIGAHAIINTAATIDHDCVIGDFAHIAPGARLAGHVVVGEGAFIGVGSAAIQCVKIGAWTTAGAGSVIVRDLPDEITAFGVPARPKPLQQQPQQSSSNSPR